MAKKKMADPVIFDLSIKMAEGKTAKKDKIDKFYIDSPLFNKEDLTLVQPDDKDDDSLNMVDTCVELDQQIENLRTELAGHEKTLIEESQKSKDKAFKEDKFVKTVYVKGTSQTIQVQFREAYSKLDSSMKEPLQQIFGVEKYPIMFTDIETATLREEKKDELKKLLGTRYTDFFNVEKTIAPSKEFMYNYFTLRKSLTETQMTTVQKIVDATRYSPAIKYPK